MDNVIERIAHFADIDTRRAMGFGPRKLIAPDLNLPRDLEQYTEFNQDVCRYIELRNARLCIGPLDISWMFGTDNFMKSRCYSFSRNDGRVTLYFLGGMNHSIHPDFNEDGSLKSWRSL